MDMGILGFMFNAVLIFHVCHFYEKSFYVYISPRLQWAPVAVGERRMVFVQNVNSSPNLHSSI